MTRQLAGITRRLNDFSSQIAGLSRQITEMTRQPNPTQPEPKIFVRYSPVIPAKAGIQ
uniref:Uncharacterized protein n=1 Tax=Candidatus Kentrum sp. UNK TaxID=2126344 RepID=A0A451ANV5_9GAMM|nr:MAG: hypothetical protein BECKUNK1418G_GA0071005_11607 [Candidatus Kentron sp. UNK]VFK73098.1 MAG: hypothetical protein BECKUNK1418H_GA0071006_11627 [Candidatus Kentron sp. UNK]